MEIKKKPGRGSSPNSKRNLKPIKKGEVRNPEGGRAHDPLKKFTGAYLREVIEMAVMGNLTELKALAEDPKTPAIQVGVAKVLFEGISTGDWDIVEKLLARTIGKVPDKIDTTSNGNTIGGPFTVKFVKPTK